MEISLQGVYDTSKEWASGDFVDHYRNSGGQAVTLRETGYLVKVVGAYFGEVEERLKDQIADAARANLGRDFLYDFVSTYDMTSLVFSLGNTTIGGIFSGNSVVDGTSLIIGGRIEFFQNDAFADPTDFGYEPFDPYPITDKWSGSLVGRINTDPRFRGYVYRP